MRFFPAAAAAVFLSAPAVHAAVIDFENFDTGAVLTGLTDLEVDGVGYDIVVDSNGSFDVAMVFDTNNPTGGDSDLAAPFNDGAGGTSSPGKVLIISEDGDSSDPDDEGKGGTITFSFDAAVNIVGFEAFDDVSLTVITSAGSTVVDVASDNQFASVTTNFFGVQEIVFDFGNQSGAIDNLSVAAIPLPAPALLLLAGMGGLGVVARKRRKAA